MLDPAIGAVACQPGQVVDPSASAEGSEAIDPAALIAASGLFDRAWYRATYPDVAARGIDPVLHYLNHGAAEGRSPGPHFDGPSYLAAHPEVAGSRVNPLVHFVLSSGGTGNPVLDAYRRWVLQYDTLTDADRIALRTAVHRLRMRPTITLVVALGSASAEQVGCMISSVRRQFYPYWQLCIAADRAGNPGDAEWLSGLVQRDSRFRLVEGSFDDLATALNTAAAVASGQYLARLDPTDVLAEHALFWIAHDLASQPATDIVYSDEDRINTGNIRSEPHFKPDWNPALALARDYVGRLTVYRRSLFEAAGRFRSGLAGAEDHDLLLRCTERTTVNAIRHVPRVLCHRAEAVRPDGGSDPATWRAGARAIVEHLVRSGIHATVTPALGCFYQVEYAPPQSNPSISIVVPTTGGSDLLARCIGSILDLSTYRNFEIVLTVNAAHYASPKRGERIDRLAALQKVRLILYPDRPFNYAWANNYAIAQTAGQFLCLLNDDTEVVTPDWLERFLARLSLNGVGAVGPMLYYPDGTVQQAGVVLGLNGVAGHTFVALPRGSSGYQGRAGLEQDLSCVTGACMAVRRDAFEAVGGFDESLAVAFNDVDLCIRLRRAGWRILWTPAIEIYHHESATIGKHDAGRQGEFEREALLVRTRWKDVLDRDPAYNPNLSITSNDYSLGFPPRIGKLATLASG